MSVTVVTLLLLCVNVSVNMIQHSCWAINVDAIVYKCIECFKYSSKLDCIIRVVVIARMRSYNSYYCHTCNCSGYTLLCVILIVVIDPIHTSGANNAATSCQVLVHLATSDYLGTNYHSSEIL